MAYPLFAYHNVYVRDWGGGSNVKRLQLVPLVLTVHTQHRGSINRKHWESVSVSFLARLLTLDKHTKGLDSFFQKLNIHSNFLFLSVYQNNILPRKVYFPQWYQCS
jgi:hypothetical protein